MVFCCCCCVAAAAVVLVIIVVVGAGSLFLRPASLTLPQQMTMAVAAAFALASQSMPVGFIIFLLPTFRPTGY